MPPSDKPSIRRLTWLLASIVVLLAIAFLAGLSGDTASHTASTADSRTTQSLPALRNEENRLLLARIPNADPGNRLYLEELLRQKEREGRDNALIHYIVGGALLPEASGAVQDAVSECMWDGWTTRSEVSRPYLKASQPAFEEIRKGSSLNYAHGIGFDLGFQAPQFRLGDLLRTGKAMCAEGLHLEKQGRYQEALDGYLAALTMACDLSSKGLTALSHMIGPVIDRYALDQIAGLSQSSHLDVASLERLLIRLKRTEKTQAPVTATLDDVEQWIRITIPDLGKDPDELLIQAGYGPQNWRQALPYEILRYRVSHNLDAAQRDSNDLLGLSREFLRTPWWEMDKSKYSQSRKEKLPQGHVVARLLLPYDLSTLMMIKERFTASQTRLRACQLITAIALWKAKHGSPPATLADLRPEFFPGGLPVDPFSGRDFVYSPGRGGRYWLVSAGSDGKDDGDALKYDPTNGSYEGDDLILAPKTRD